MNLGRTLEKLTTFDVEAADLEDGEDDEPDADDEEDGPPITPELVRPKVIRRRRPASGIRPNRLSPWTWVSRVKFIRRPRRLRTYRKKNSKMARTAATGTATSVINLNPMPSQPSNSAFSIARGKANT